ncbi:15266_t:CDS:2 [Gigaspora margarita]|uniref:15266_t:CDS:1 n=1 Tax=Gigaspora margarita TaxID=4874 RepID=A0ABN7WL04_GIGMA|nr:15266_t:CDS:2 [Gigaspora margarita]
MTQRNNIANSQYAKILNEFRCVGAYFAVNIPTIVFCDFSVKLPKSDGACTRCVMELGLIQSSDA